MAHDLIAEALEAGAGFITGLGEWRAGRGAIVTDWMPTKEAAAEAFLAADLIDREAGYLRVARRAVESILAERSAIPADRRITVTKPEA